VVSAATSRARVPEDETAQERRPSAAAEADLGVDRAGDACPIYPGKRYVDWELDDPAGKAIETVRPIRDEIRAR